MLVPMAPDDRRSLDFVSDQLTDGRRFRILTVEIAHARWLALVADTSLSGIRVARELDRLIIERGKPKMISAANSPIGITLRRQAHAERLHRKLQRPAVG
jgi:putative transposase